MAELKDKDLQVRLDLCRRAQKIMESRAEYYRQTGRLEMAQAYSNAGSMLLYAVKGNSDCLKEFDPYILEPLKEANEDA